ncbi:carbohydrate ABC transporter permease [Vallitalea okinawensis]|uniref:carbohydrate ABC transporter permease n=1 Tax=Vallitalea okinawensis TaxID=2078660 RepID=UPI001FA81C89|nr:carbohydrate ABC transporter permease [Vallitalea okinawensis]
MLYKRSKDDLLVDLFCYLFLIILSITIIIPFMQVITISFSPTHVINSYGLKLFPTEITLEGYKKVFSDELIWSGYMNTIFVTVVGTILNVLFSVLGAYPLSKRYLPYRNMWTGLIVFTMYFSGGLIPSYMLVKNLGMLNSLTALILPGLISAYNMIIMRNYFMSLPESLEESARIDGAHDYTILFKIILPLSKPIIATVSLWYGVHHWNSWFHSMIYIQDRDKQVLQYVLRLILSEGQVDEVGETLAEAAAVNSETMKMAALVVATLPIICVYPFIQKYFVKGVMVGSLKG